METWLITGGAGFIGCNFVRLVLRETAARVVILDKLTYAGQPRQSRRGARGHARDVRRRGHRRPRDRRGGVHAITAPRRS